MDYEGEHEVKGKFDLKGISVAGISAAVPKEEVNFTALKENGVEYAFIDNFIKNTGIRCIRKSDFTQTASDFAFSAAKELEKFNLYKPEEIGVLVYITQTPDYRTPSTACALHKRLELPSECLAFDVNLGCSGFVYGITIASSLLKASTHKKALILVGDSLARGRIQKCKNSKNNEERTSNTGFLFGDASAAILLEKDETSSIQAALMSDGNGHEVLTNPYNAWKHPEGPEAVDGDDIRVFNFTIRQVPKTIKQFMESEGKNSEDYDEIVLHQANLMVLRQIAKKLKISMDKVHVSLDRFGNTSGASIPLTIVDKFGNVEGSNPVKFLTSGFGVGLSWGVVSFEVCPDKILPLVISTDTYKDSIKDEN